MDNSKRQLGLVAATFIVLGNIVGVMIFLEQPAVAKSLPWTGWFLAAWILGGVLALLGALSLAELGVMMPKAGGDYVYIREAYGARWAFLSGWTSVAITFPGSIAAMCVAICTFQAPAALGPWVKTNALYIDLGATYYFNVTWAQILSLSLIAGITGVNHIGIRPTGWVQTAITSTPILLLLAAGVAALFVSPSGPEPKAVIDAAGKSPWIGLWPAIVPIFFAYAGWNVTTYIGGEIAKPARNLPLSLIIGTSISIVIYVVICLVFLKGVPVRAMPGTFDVGSLALTRLFGGFAGKLFLLVIALAVLGSVNATVLAGSRITYAMADDGLLPKPLAGISNRFGTPVAALWAQAGLAGILALSGSFEQLVNYVVAVMLIFSSLAVGAVIVLRVRRPQAERLYKTLGYPATPALYILFSLGVVLSLAIKKPTPVIYGVVITAIGWPVFEWMRLRRKELTKKEAGE